MSQAVSRLLPTLVIGIVLGVPGAGVLEGQPAPGTTPPRIGEIVLLRTDLAGLPGSELIVSRLRAEPGWRHGRHFHAGHELVYVLAGTGTLRVDGQPALALAPGTAAHVPPRQVHTGGNASPSGPFEFLLVRIHEKGQPISVELE